MRYIILSSLILISVIGFSQSESNKTIFNKVAAGEISKLNLNLYGYNFNKIGEFKDELLTFEEKIIRVEFDETSSTLTIVYNEHMLKEDFITVFEKYDINYINENKTDFQLQAQ